VSVQIAGKVALVTGAGSGLGLATTRTLVAHGAHVIAIDTRPSDSLTQLGSGVTLIEGDVRSAPSVGQAVKAAESTGCLAIVVNCAGIGSSTRVVGRSGVFPLEQFQQVVEVNLVGTFNVVRLAAAAMIRRVTRPDEEERGVIVNTASIAAFDGQVGQVAYAASKAGISGMTLPLARDLAQHRIRVVTIAPGLFRTPLFETLPAEAVASLEAQTPHPSRLGHPTEYADLVRHVVENPMLNGETIRLDAAIRMAPR
jgi:NAD(P)-dependent dehydrogenase (short-subunit alcohol dehydrogenase family)